MKNYYDQQMELLAATYRLETLYEKKQIYFETTQPKSPKYKEISVTSSHVPSESFLKYAEKVEELDKEIESLEVEIKILEKYLLKMERCLRNMKGILERVFVDKYIDGLKVNQISRKEHYSQPQIYRFLSTINAIIKNEKK